MSSLLAASKVGSGAIKVKYHREVKVKLWEMRDECKCILGHFLFT